MLLVCNLGLQAVILILMILLPDQKPLFLWILLIILACIQAGMLIGKARSARYRRRFRRSERISYKRLEFIRQIVELAYTYSHDPDVFHRKVCEEMHLEKMKRNQVIDFEEETAKHRLLKTKERLSEDDAEFYCLIKAGFTPRELSIIFGHGNPKSIYVKKCRLMKKLKDKSVGG